MFVALLLAYVCAFLGPVTGDIHQIANIFGAQQSNPPPCLRICSGSTGWSQTAWSGGSGYIKTTIDMSRCDFILTPIVTTSLYGYNMHRHAVGVNSIYDLSKDSFTVEVMGPAWTAYRNTRWGWTLTPGEADRRFWSVMWFAMGYVC